MSLINIEQLIEQCKLNNQLAQLNIYKLYSKGMYNVSFRIVNDSAVAEDIVQESFITAFDDLSKLEKASAFGSWLKKMVTYKSINHLRKEKKMQLSSLETLEYKIIDEKEEDCFFSGATIQIVYQAIKELKQNYRLLLTLHYIEGFDYEEIVEITGLSHANCRTTISRAKESLRKKLNIYAK